MYLVNVREPMLLNRRGSHYSMCGDEGIILISDSASNFANNAAHTRIWCMQEDKQKREDRALRDPDYDSHLGVARDPVTREIVATAG